MSWLPTGEHVGTSTRYRNGNLPMMAHRRDTEMTMEARSQLERQMRACILGVLALRKRRRRKYERPLQTIVVLIRILLRMVLACKLDLKFQKCA